MILFHFFKLQLKDFYLQKIVLYLFNNPKFLFKILAFINYKNKTINYHLSFQQLCLFILFRSIRKKGFVLFKKKKIFDLFMLLIIIHVVTAFYCLVQITKNIKDFAIFRKRFLHIPKN